MNQKALNHGGFLFSYHIIYMGGEFHSLGGEYQANKQIFLS